MKLTSLVLLLPSLQGLDSFCKGVCLLLFTTVLIPFIRFLTRPDLTKPFCGSGKKIYLLFLLLLMLI